MLVDQEKSIGYFLIKTVFLISVLIRVYLF
jgi:hypothetical protein